MTQTKLKTDRMSVSWWRTDFGEADIQAVTNAINAVHISQGPVTLDFELRIAKALGVPYVVATSSGSVAILMALMALGIGRDDEVIVPNRTWIATAHAPLMLGAKVKVVDVLPNVPIMDVSQLKDKITSRTKAIIPVSLNGRAVDMEQIWTIADEFGLAVVEDAAQSLFSKRSGKYMGTESDAGCFSLSIAKLIPTGQGGFVVTRQKEIYENLKRIRMHGVDDVIHCNFYQMGFNFRFTDLQASIGIAQLNCVEKRIKYLKEVYTRYEEELKQFSFLKLIPVDISRGEIPIYVEVLCKEREKLVIFLANEGIQTRPIYPNLETAVYLGVSGEFPNAKVFSEQGLVLPCGPGQSLDNINRVIDMLRLYEEESDEIRD